MIKNIYYFRILQIKDIKLKNFYLTYIIDSYLTNIVRISSLSEFWKPSTKDEFQ